MRGGDIKMSSPDRLKGNADDLCEEKREGYHVNV